MTAPPAVLGQLRHGHRGRRGFARSRRHHERPRVGQGVPGRQRPQAVACRKREGEELGKAQTLLDMDHLGSWYPAPEAPQGKPGHGTRLAPPLHGGPGARPAEEARHRESPPETDGGSSPAEYAAVGPAYDMGKDVTEGRSPHRKLMPDPGGPAPHEPTSLRGRAHKARADKQHRWRELYRGLAAPLLRACWDALNKAAARGGDHGTAEESAVPLQGTIEALAQRLKAKRYRTKLGRRCYLPKANGQERPLGRPALEDHMGQLAWATLLTASYAQAFLECSDA